MDINKRLNELISLSKEYLSLVGYNSLEKSELRDKIENERDQIIYEVGLTYEFSNRYLNLKALVLDDTIKFSKDSKCNINFIKKDFLKLLNIVKGELATNPLIKDLDTRSMITSDKEVSKIKNILDTSSMLKIRLVFEFIDLNPELLFHFTYESFINDIISEYSEEIKNNYDLITTFIDVPCSIDTLISIIKSVNI